MKTPTLEQVIAFAQSDLDAKPTIPPDPYQIALTLAAALLSSGRYADDGGAAVATAWTLVLPFYQGQAAYEAQGKMLFEMMSPPEGSMSLAEARAYVTGGETGNTGETLAARGIRASEVITPDPHALAKAVEKQTRMHEATLKVQAAAIAVEEARRSLPVKGRAGRVKAAVAAFDEAAAAQSAAYDS